MRALVAGAAIVLLLTVLPLALLRLSTALPLDVSALSPSGLTRPDDGALLLLLLVAIAWASWAVLAMSVSIELIAAVRGVPTPRVRGLGAPQRLAGALVTALLVGTLPIGASAGQPAVALTDLAVTMLAGQSDLDGLVGELDGRAAADATEAGRSTRPDESQVRDHPVIVTQRHDTLWLLAEQYLGSGERFSEIVALNLGIRQGDGRALQDDGRLYPGWELRLPEDADLKAQRPGRHVVQPGDTLWDIADQELHDPTRFPELVDATRGDLQPDGRQLREADLILPGWVIELPIVEPAADSDETRIRRRDDRREEDGSSSARTADGAAAAQGLDGRGMTGGSPTPPPSHPAPESADPTSSAPDGDPAREAPAVGGSQWRPGAAEPLTASSTPSSPPASTPASAPASTPASAPASAPSSVPASAPASTPASVPSSAPASVPSSAPASVPSSAPSSKPPSPPSSAPASAAASATSEAAATGSVRSESSDPGQSRSSAPDADSGDDLVAADDRAGIALPAGGVAAALLLAALGVELARRRTQFQRWRRPGENLPTPSGRARSLEGLLRNRQGSRDGELLAAALFALSAGPRSVPIRVIELGPDSVVVHLAQDYPDDLPEPFRRLTGRCLIATRDALQGSAGGTNVPHAKHPLVTVGTQGERTILVDLASVGTMRLAGDDQLVGAVLRAIAAEVAMDPRHQGHTRTLCLLDGHVADAAEAGEVILDADPERVGRAVATALRRGQGAPATTEAPAGLSARSGDPTRAPGDAEPGGLGSTSGPAISPAEVNPAGAHLLGPAQAPVGVLEGFDAVIDLRADGAPGPINGSGDPGSGLVRPDAGRFEDSARGSAVPPDLAGARGGDEWSDPFEIVVTDRPIRVEVPPRSGVGLVTSAVTSGMGITLAVLDVGRAVLVEDGIELSPVGLSVPTVEDLVELFAATDVPGAAQETLAVPWTGERGVPAPETAAARSTDERVLAPEHLSAAATGESAAPVPGTDRPGSAQSSAEHDAPNVATSRRAEPGTGDATERTWDAAEPQGPGEPEPGLALGPSEARAPRLLLLGDVEVENAQGRAESARLGRLAETAAFVLLHPNARPSELLAALWPGRNANPQSCRQMISRTRSWLGRTDDGEPYLEPFAQTSGRLRLRPEVRSDWDDFQALADRGLADPGDVASLSAALELVRGRPFGSLWRRELAWADLDAHRMISRIVDVAYELALRHEAAGRVREARAALHRALRTQVESELVDELLERLDRA